jgi:hypothetical protein
MANLTIVVDDEALRRARIRALEQGISVNELLRGFLESYANVRAEQAEAGERVLSVARSTAAGSGPGGRRWTREELHDRR